MQFSKVRRAKCVVTGLPNLETCSVKVVLSSLWNQLLLINKHNLFHRWVSPVTFLMFIFTWAWGSGFLPLHAAPTRWLHKGPVAHVLLGVPWAHSHRPSLQQPHLAYIQCPVKMGLPSTAKPSFYTFDPIFSPILSGLCSSKLLPYLSLSLDVGPQATSVGLGNRDCSLPVQDQDSPTPLQQLKD